MAETLKEGFNCSVIVEGSPIYIVRGPMKMLADGFMGVSKASSFAKKKKAS